MISQYWVLLAIVLFHYHGFCTRFRRIHAHDRWHLQRKQVAACTTVTFRGPGAGICRRQLRSALGTAFRKKGIQKSGLLGLEAFGR